MKDIKALFGLLDLPRKFASLELRIKRLERGKGSERRLVTSPRSGAEQAGAEKRSEEDMRVTPVEAMDALEWAEVSALNAAVDRDQRAEICENAKQYDGASHHKAQAARFRKIANVLHTLIPKPESEACRRLGAPPKIAAFMMPDEVDKLLNERSGRRNANVDAPAHE